MTAPLALTLRAPAVTDPRRRFAITARFTNVSTQPVRLLALFDPLPVFFDPTLIAEDGSQVDVAGMGKADPPKASLRYWTLHQGEHHEVSLDIARWLRGDVPPPPYRLSMAYHNVYGENCFVGILNSPPITVSAGAAS